LTNSRIGLGFLLGFVTSSIIFLSTKTLVDLGDSDQTDQSDKSDELSNFGDTVVTSVAGGSQRNLPEFVERIPDGTKIQNERGCRDDVQVEIVGVEIPRLADGTDQDFDGEDSDTNPHEDVKVDVHVGFGDQCAVVIGKQGVEGHNQQEQLNFGILDELLTGVLNLDFHILGE